MKIYIRDLPNNLQNVVLRLQVTDELTIEKEWGVVKREGVPHDRKLSYIDSEVVLDELVKAVEKRSIDNQYNRRASTKKRLEKLYELIELIEALSFNKTM